MSHKATCYLWKSYYCESCEARESYRVIQSIKLNLKQGHLYRGINTALYSSGPRAVTIPISAGYARPAKWIRQQDDGQVELLTGEDHNEIPYVTELYADPSYDFDRPVEAMP